METASFGRRPEARLKVHYWAHYEVSSINVLGIDTIRHSKYLGRGFGNRRAGRKRSAIIRRQLTTPEGVSILGIRKVANIIPFG
jgi:hypothetical protein